MPTRTVTLKVSEENYKSLQALAQRLDVPVHGAIHIVLMHAMMDYGIYWQPPGKPGRPKKSKNQKAPE